MAHAHQAAEGVIRDKLIEIWNEFRRVTTLRDDGIRQIVNSPPQGWSEKMILDEVSRIIAESSPRIAALTLQLGEIEASIRE